jgi:uroporphyrinogen-III synthase
MSIVSQATETSKYKKIKSILISQPKPVQKSPYFDLEQKYGIQIDFREFTQVAPVAVKEVRRQKVSPADYPSIIFRCCEEMRAKMSPETKYFCLTENIANYLQKFIIYRKRKVFVGVKNIEDLKAYFIKHREKDVFLLPCSTSGAKDLTNFLTENNVRYQEAHMFETVSADLSDLSDITYDVLVFFNQQAIKSLFDNFPDFKQNETRIAVFGKSTATAALSKELILNIEAPMPDVPSMPMALENYIKIANKD